MASHPCPSCGAETPVDAGVCVACGQPLAVPAVPPSPRRSWPGEFNPLVPPGPFGAPPAPARRRSRVRGVVFGVVVVIVALVALAVALTVLLPRPPAVNVQYIYVWATDNVCGLNANQIYYYGYTSGTGASRLLELPVPNYNATACQIVSVQTNSTGFHLAGALPAVAVPASGSAVMNLTVVSPSLPFSGDLNLVFA